MAETEPGLLFVSYHPKDQRWYERLRQHLRPLEHQGLLRVWSRQEIVPGEEFDQAVREAVCSARMALVLASANYLASEAIQRLELEPLILRARTEGMPLTWLQVRPVAFEGSGLEEFQPLRIQRPLSTLSGSAVDEALVRVVEQLLAMSRPPSESIWESGVQPEAGKLADRTEVSSAPESRGSRGGQGSTLESALLSELSSELPRGLTNPRSFSSGSGLTDFAWAPGGEVLATGSVGSGGRLWSADRGQLAWKGLARKEKISAVTWNAAGALAVARFGFHDITLWSPDLSEQRTIAIGAPGDVLHLHASPLGSLVAVVLHDSVRFFDSSRSTERTRLAHVGSVRALAFIGGSRRMALPLGNRVEIFDLIPDLPDVSIGRTISLAHDVSALAWSAATEILAIGTETGEIVIWDPTSGESSAELVGHTGPVQELSFSWDGRLLASCSWDATIRLRRTDTWDTVASLPVPPFGRMLHKAIAFNPVRPILASAVSIKDAIVCFDVDYDALIGSGGKKTARAPVLDAVSPPITFSVSLSGGHSALPASQSRLPAGHMPRPGRPATLPYASAEADEKLADGWFKDVDDSIELPADGETESAALPESNEPELELKELELEALDLAKLEPDALTLSALTASLGTRPTAHIARPVPGPAGTEKIPPARVELPQSGRVSSRTVRELEDDPIAFSHLARQEEGAGEGATSLLDRLRGWTRRSASSNREPHLFSVIPAAQAAPIEVAPEPAAHPAPIIIHGVSLAQPAPIIGTGMPDVRSASVVPGPEPGAAQAPVAERTPIPPVPDAAPIAPVSADIERPSAEPGPVSMGTDSTPVPPAASAEETTPVAELPVQPAAEPAPVPSIPLAPPVPLSESVHYANARVVLIGESGTGKTCLARALMGEPYIPQDSTHGLKVWTFQSETVTRPEGIQVLRETMLWDLAGQTDYQVIHQLFLDKTSLAIVLIDASHPQNPFGGVGHWEKALQRIAGPECARILVAGRVDRGAPTVSRETIDAFCLEHDFAAFVATSASTGEGIAALREAIARFVPWERLPVTTSPRLWHDIRAYLIRRRDTAQALAPVLELRETFRRENPEALFSEVRFDTVIDHAQAQGLVWRLSWGDFLLMRPELLDDYGSAVVRAARKQPDGLGCVLERDVLTARLDFEKLERVTPQEEQVLLPAVVELFLARELALRQESYLVFPSRFNRVHPDYPTPPRREVAYRFAGPIESLYATLVVRLSYSGAFTLKGLYQNATELETEGGSLCGITLSGGDGTGQVSIFFGPDTSMDVKLLFVRFIHQHLSERAVSGSMVRERIYRCPECGEEVENRRAVAIRLEKGLDTIACQFCDAAIPLRDALEARFGDQELLRKVRGLERTIDQRRDREVGVTAVGVKEGRGEFDVFLAHNSHDWQVVQVLGEALRGRGINPWIDREQVPPGRWFQDILQQALRTVKSVAILIGAHGVGPWQTRELSVFMNRCIDDGMPLIPVLLPGVTDCPAELVFLQELQQVRFQRVEDPEALDALEWGITGRHPRRR